MAGTERSVVRRHQIMKKELVDRVRKRIAQTAIGPSALRNQGGANVVQRARDFLRSVDLAAFRVGTEAGFRARLDKATEALRSRLPRGARNWGTARKALNLFLRDAVYSFYVREYYGLARLEPWLEVPLDSLVAAEILRSRDDGALPRWPGVKHLSPEISDAYQRVASRIGSAAGVYRVHLDLSWWRA